MEQWWLGSGLARAVTPAQFLQDREAVYRKSTKKQWLRQGLAMLERRLWDLAVVRSSLTFISFVSFVCNSSVCVCVCVCVCV
jgi:hypothetical protein